MAIKVAGADQCDRVSTDAEDAVDLRPVVSPLPLISSPDESAHNK